MYHLMAWWNYGWMFGDQSTFKNRVWPSAKTVCPVQF